MTDILNLKIGRPERYVTIKDITLKPVDIMGKSLQKIVFTVQDDNGKTFNISDCWLENNGKKETKGLWFNSKTNEISHGSAIAKLLKFNNVDTLKDLLNKTVLVYPDTEDFLILTACDMNSQGNTLTKSKDSLFL